MGLVLTAGIRPAGRKAMTSATKLFLSRRQCPVGLFQGFGSGPGVLAGFPGPFGPLAELGRVLGVVLDPVGQQHPQLFRISDGPPSHPSCGG